MDVRQRRELMVAGQTVVEAVDLDDYAALAYAVTGPSDPLPVPAGVWHRFAAAVDALPAAAPTPGYWHGAVHVTGPEYAPVAHVLAATTGRALRRGTLGDALAAARNTPVTVVARADEITPELLAELPVDGQLGLLTGRDLNAVAALVARTVLQGPRSVAELDDLWFDMFAEPGPAPRTLLGPAATPRSLRAALRPGAAMLAGRGHARDCLLHLNGGGICGRAEEQPRLNAPLPVGAGWSDHPAACQQSDRCWRDDVPVAGHLRAAELRAAVVVLDSCRTAQAGEGSVRREVALPLTMLEGVPLALVCAVGTRGGSDWAGQLFPALVRAGLPLGAALAEVNTAVTDDEAGLGRLALFGDAGLASAVPKPPVTYVPGDEIPAGRAAALVRGTELLPVDPDGPLMVTRRGGDSWAVTTAAQRRGGRVEAMPASPTAQWEELRTWVQRLRVAPQMGLRIDRAVLDEVYRDAAAAVRRRAEAGHASAAVAADADFADAARRLAEQQALLVRTEIERFADNVHFFVDGWAEPWSVRIAPEPDECPQCGDHSLLCHTVRPSAGCGEPLRYDVCVRCGEMSAGAAEQPGSVTVRNPAQARRCEPVPIRIIVTAPSDASITVAVGAAFPHPRRLGVVMAGDGAAFTLGPGERRELNFTAHSGDSAALDQQVFKVVVAVNGAVRFLTRWVWLRG
ncbi:zinc ribbon domain-containing protein [Micromonospora parva]|uniref:zinc ribbon domain-containing protein n=1 Tax=Micromonospora parva TaxID=1464048 RepID=UPI0033F355EB